MTLPMQCLLQVIEEVSPISDVPSATAPSERSSAVKNVDHEALWPAPWFAGLERTRRNVQCLTAMGTLR